MRGLTTHILDTGAGMPAEGININVEMQDGPGTGWQQIGQGITNQDGRVIDLLAKGFELKKGIYRMTFATKPYFEKQNRATFYPHVEIYFEIQSLERHYHVPLLISGFGYSTYRGS